MRSADRRQRHACRRIQIEDLAEQAVTRQRGPDGERDLAAALAGRDEQRGQPRHLEDGFHRRRQPRDDERPLHRREPLVELHQHADAGRAQERDLLEVEAQAQPAFADGLGDAGVEVLGPVAIEAALDDQVGPIAGGPPGDLHQRAPTTRSARATRLAGSVRPIRRAEPGLTTSRVLPTFSNGMPPGRSPRMTRTASVADCMPASW